ncbi:disease resistance response protein 206-like [Wolffia australiana]
MERGRSSSTKLSSSPFFFFFLFLFLLLGKTQARRERPKPCKSLVVFWHDILYNGANRRNASSVIVAAPAWGNRTVLSSPNNFGDVVVFDDPLTTDDELSSKPVGRAQGLYLYDSQAVYSAWLAFTLVLNSSAHVGTMNLIGYDPLLNKTREVAVVGGTGDFFMARGIATLTTRAFEGSVYFRLRLDIKLYECY